MILTVSQKSKQILLDSPVKKLGYSKEEFMDLYGRHINSFYQSIEWGIRSAEILKRDNWSCKFCKDIHANYVHHIRGVKVFTEINLHPDYLITVCVTCHNKIHRKR